MATDTILLDNLAYPEGPRWHDGRLYVADFYAHEVVWCDLQGNQGVHLAVPGQPSGMGWLPDGRQLVVSMRDASVLVVDGTHIDTVADLSALSPCANELVVDGHGRAYVGGMPNLYDVPVQVDELSEGVPPQMPVDNLYLIEDQGRGKPAKVTIVASDINFPNGTVITPDGKRLIIAESMSNRLLCFDINEDGTLQGRRVWADLPGVPDGICLDAEGCVWAALPFPEQAKGFHRVREGGEILETIESDRVPMAVMLGGPTRHNMFLVESSVVGTGDGPELRRKGNGRVRMRVVDVPGDGRP